MSGGGGSQFLRQSPNTLKSKIPYAHWSRGQFLMLSPNLLKYKIPFRSFAEFFLGGKNYTAPSFSGQIQMYARHHNKHDFKTEHMWPYILLKVSCTRRSRNLVLGALYRIPTAHGPSQLWVMRTPMCPTKDFHLDKGSQPPPWGHRSIFLLYPNGGVRECFGPM